MLKLLVSTLLIIASQNSFAESQSTSFGRTNSNFEVLSQKDLRERFELSGQIYVTDHSGRLLFQAPESRLWKFGSQGDLLSNWSYQAKGLPDIAIKHRWTLSKDGLITAHIQQFESMKRRSNGRDVKTGKLVREETILVKDFAPINWVAHQDNKQHIVVRLSPHLGDKADMMEIQTLPVTLTNPVVFDSQGRLWAQGHDLEGNYLAMKTHMGQFAISYSPFRGAKEIGYVQGNEMTLNVNKNLKLYVRSDSPILATQRPAKLYGFVKQDRKSERVHSVQSSASNKEKDFLKNL